MALDIRIAGRYRLGRKVCACVARVCLSPAEALARAARPCTSARKGKTALDPALAPCLQVGGGSFGDIYLGTYACGSPPGVDGPEERCSRVSA